LILGETGHSRAQAGKRKGRVDDPSDHRPAPGFQERALITSTAFDQAYQSAIAFGTANLPQIAPDSPLIPIGGRSPASIKIPDDRITQELHDQKQYNSHSNHYEKVEKFVNMHPLLQTFTQHQANSIITRFNTEVKPFRITPVCLFAICPRRTKAASEPR
jgi:hypothetical protein